MILDIFGKTVFVNYVSAESGILKINAEDYSKGIYLVQVTTDNRVVTRKILNR